MLSGNFFNLDAVNNVAGKLTGTIQFNTTHSIFDGHFPGQPVVPGVCMMQMVKEILREELGVAARLKMADHVKFLTVINPLETGSVNFEFSYAGLETGELKLSATLLNNDTIYFKMRGVFLVSIGEIDTGTPV